MTPAGTPGLQHFLALAALAPQRLGFNSTDAKTYRKLPDAVKARCHGAKRDTSVAFTGRGVNKQDVLLSAKVKH